MVSRPSCHGDIDSVLCRIFYRVAVPYGFRLSFCRLIKPEQVSLSLFQVCRPQVFVPMTLECHIPYKCNFMSALHQRCFWDKTKFLFFSAETVICSAELNCEGHFCIRQSWKCDQSVDCFDQSDEDACGNYSRCHTNFFLLFFRCVFAHDSHFCSKYNVVSVSN